MDAHADAKVHALVPRVFGQRALPGQGGVDRVLRPAERNEERVALRPDPLAAGLLEGRSKQTVMIREHLDPPVTQTARKHRRALDVAKEEGECSAGRFRHVGRKRAMARSGSPN